MSGVTTVEIPNRSLFRQPEVCEIAKVQPYVLRSWEAEFPDLGVGEDEGGPRVYRRADVERVLRHQASAVRRGADAGRCAAQAGGERPPTAAACRERGSTSCRTARKRRARADLAGEARPQRDCDDPREGPGRDRPPGRTCSSCRVSKGAEVEREPRRKKKKNSVRGARSSASRFRDVAQPGSAPDWGSGGRWFESSHPDQFPHCR